MVGDEIQSAEPCRLLGFERAHFLFDAQHVDIRFPVVQGGHGTVDQAIVVVGEHSRQEALCHVGNSVALCDNGHDDRPFHLLRCRNGCGEGGLIFLFHEVSFMDLIISNFVYLPSAGYIVCPAQPLSLSLPGEPEGGRQVRSPGRRSG